MVLLLMVLPAVVMQIQSNMIDNVQGTLQIIPHPPRLMGLNLEIKTLWGADNTEQVAA